MVLCFLVISLPQSISIHYLKEKRSDGEAMGTPYEIEDNNSMAQWPMIEHYLSGLFIILDQEKYNKEFSFEESIIIGGSVHRHGTHRMCSGLAENKFV